MGGPAMGGPASAGGRGMSLPLLLLLLGILLQAAGEADPSASETQDGQAPVDEKNLLRDFIEWLKVEGMPDIGMNSSPVQPKLLEGQGRTQAQPTSILGLSPLATGKWKARSGIRLVAARNVTKGDVLAVVPSHLVISANHAFGEGEAPCSGSDVMRQVPSTIIAMAAWVLQEKAKGSDSLWAPYIALLPSYVPLPFYYEDDLLDEFQDKDMKIMCRSLRGLFEEVHKRCNSGVFAHASLAEFIWAISMTLTRSISPGINVCGAAAQVDATKPSADLILVPLMDLMDHSFEEPSVSYKCNADGSLSLYATSDVSMGAPLYMNYASLSNSEWVIKYGFSANENPHDYATMFHTIPEVVDYYVTNFRQHDFNDIDKAWAEKVGKAAVESVNNMLKARPEGIPRSRDEFSTEMGYPALSYGRVEPRLVAVLAAIWHYDSYRAEPKYEELSRLSIMYGWNHDGVTCDQLYELPDELNYSIQRALGIIFERALQIIKAFPTTFDQDMSSLGLLFSCQEGKDLRRCPEEFADLHQELQVVLQYRIGRKRLLYDLTSRLLQVCEAPEELENGSDENSPGRAVSADEALNQNSSQEEEEEAEEEEEEEEEDEDEDEDEGDYEEESCAS